MKEEPVTDAVARRFLLGDVEDVERQRIETLFISDPDSKRRILIVEEDLIEDYLEDCLTRSEREKFLAQYGYTPEQRRKLRITRSIKEHAVAEYVPAQTVNSVSPKWRTLVSALQPRNRSLFIPVAAVMMVLLVVTVIWLVGLNRKRMQENNRRLAIEQELASLNAAPSPREISPEVSSLVLPPVSVRSVGAQAELTPGPGTRIFELQLLWTQKEQYPSYQAVLRRVGSLEQFTIPDLHADKGLGGNIVRLRIPAHLLTHGLYQVILSGVASDGTPRPVEEYSFAIGS